MFYRNEPSEGFKKDPQLLSNLNLKDILLVVKKNSVFIRCTLLDTFVESLLEALLAP